MYKFILLTVVAIATCIQAFSNPNDVHAEILKLNSEVREDGSYQYAFDTSNGISAQESGVGGHYANGGYSFYSPEGEPIQVSYTADENGFQPSGHHLPTPPPVPYQILNALEYIRTHPQYDESQQYRSQYNRLGHRH